MIERYLTRAASLSILVTVTSCSPASPLKRVVSLGDGLRMTSAESTDRREALSLAGSRASKYCSRYRQILQIDKTVTTTPEGSVIGKLYTVDYYFRCSNLRPGRNCIQSIEKIDVEKLQKKLPHRAPVGQVSTIQYSYHCPDQESTL